MMSYIIAKHLSSFESHIDRCVFEDVSFYKLNYFRDFEAIFIGKGMPAGLFLHLFRVISSTHSEYEYNLIFTIH